MDKEIHAICTLRSQSEVPEGEPLTPYHIVTRIPRLYTLLQDEFAASTTTIAYVSTSLNLPENVPENGEEPSP